MRRTAALAVVVALALGLASCTTLTGRTAGQIVDDSTIVTLINAKIVEDPGLSYLKIDVDSKAGEVTLSGFVPSADAEARVVRIAQDVKGVKSVRSLLKIQP